MFIVLVEDCSGSISMCNVNPYQEYNDPRFKRWSHVFLWFGGGGYVL